MKYKLFFLAIGFFLISASFVSAAKKNALSQNPEKFVTRGQFASIIQFESKVKRPKDLITLAEAAAFLVNAFSLEVHSEEIQPNDPWYKPYLLALEENQAIPISFWTPGDFVRRSEAVEMLDRLANDILDRPSLTFDILHGQHIPYQSKEFLRLSGDFSEPLPRSILTSSILRLFKEPGTYNIFDIDYDDKDASTSYCHRFYTQSGQVGNVTTITNQGNATVTIEALSTDYCVYPYENMEQNTCPPDAKYGDDPRCNIGKTRPYEITFEKRGKEVFVKDAESSRIRITRTPQEAICKEWTPGVCPGYYYPTKKETVGEVSVATLPNGAQWNVYRTSWHPIFSDMRGVHFLAFEKTLPNGALWRKIYQAPAHNRDAWGSGTASYEACMTDPVDFYFCMKREGNFFIVASQKELGDKTTFWIDENYRR